MALTYHQAVMALRRSKPWEWKQLQAGVRWNPLWPLEGILSQLTLGLALATFEAHIPTRSSAVRSNLKYSPLAEPFTLSLLDNPESRRQRVLQLPLYLSSPEHFLVASVHEGVQWSHLPAGYPNGLFRHGIDPERIGRGALWIAGTAGCNWPMYIRDGLDVECWIEEDPKKPGYSRAFFNVWYLPEDDLTDPCLQSDNIYFEWDASLALSDAKVAVNNGHLNMHVNRGHHSTSPLPTHLARDLVDEFQKMILEAVGERTAGFLTSP